jgi:hypothetical protein
MDRVCADELHRGGSYSDSGTEGDRRARDDGRTRLVERVRAAWLCVAAATVLLPPYLLALAALGSAAVYICMRGAKAIGAQGWDRPRLT